MIIPLVSKLFTKNVNIKDLAILFKFVIVFLFVQGLYIVGIKL